MEEKENKLINVKEKEIIAAEVAENDNEENVIIEDLQEKTKGKLGEFASKTLDVNGDGKVDIVDIIYLSLKIPGVVVDREEYFKSTFKKYYDYEIIQDAIKTTPKQAKMDDSTIEKIADDTIEFERKCATSASTALGLPGGLALLATIPTDVIQYFAFLIRAAQKLMYLYGFSSMGLKEGEEHINDEVMNTLISCLGIMFGVQGADAAIHTAALIWLKGTEQVVTKTTFSFMKPVSTSLGKIVASQLVKGGTKLVPILGGVISGGLTYVTFKTCCDKLRKKLRSMSIKNDKKS